ncbi:MAG: bifunctional 3,4-dihydroxy-2-butanone-4-phosphate synthase/GTP cyclohydrolase II [Bacteroidales bacterium]
MLNTIEEAVEDIRQGKFIIVVDDEDRENEGDFVAAAECVTPEMVNFMLNEGRGVICVPMTEARCQALELEMQVARNTSSHETPFTVTVDLLSSDCTTGVSTHDRAATIRALANPRITAKHFGRPGHINPLRAKERGVLRRAGHTEAAVDLARMAGLQPVGAIVEVMNPDGSMARLPDLQKIAKRFNLKIISVAQLIAHRLKTESIIERGDRVPFPTALGDFELIVFRQKSNGLDHIALVKGKWNNDEAILTRVHSSCATGDIFGSSRCDCGAQLQEAMRIIQQEGKGVIIYLNQEGRGIGLFHKIHAYKLQDEGMDTVEANLAMGFRDDERDYGVGASMLHEVGVQKMRLLTNNPLKRIGLEGYNLEVTENVPIIIRPNKHNLHYLKTKEEKMGHILGLK